MSKWNVYHKLELPIDVTADFEPFCSECGEVDLTACSQKFYSFDKPCMVKNTISCSKIDVCRRMYEQFKKARSEDVY